MNTTAFILLALFAVVAVSARSASPKKIAGNAQITGIKSHITKLLVKISKERTKAIAFQKANAAHCKKWIKKNTDVSRKSRATIKENKAEIKANKAIQKVLRDVKIPHCGKQYTVFEKKKDGMTTKLENGDEKRKNAREVFDAKIKVLSGHLAFVKKLYIFLMKSTVERRRSVKFFESKAKQMHSLAKSMTGKAATLMETGATLMVSGHLDAVYRLLDSLRGQLQRNIRSTQRSEMRAARHWIREHARGRAQQVSYHKKATEWSEKSSKYELKDEKYDMDNERRTRIIENNDLIADHRERNLKILKVTCKRSKFSFKNKMSQWASERKALKGLRAKINGHYRSKMIEVKAKPPRRRRRR